MPKGQKQEQVRQARTDTSILVYFLGRCPVLVFVGLGSTAVGVEARHRRSGRMPKSEHPAVDDRWPPSASFTAFLRMARTATTHMEPAFVLSLVSSLPCRQSALAAHADRGRLCACRLVCPSLCLTLGTDARPTAIIDDMATTLPGGSSRQYF
ncbi:hypothetical protein CDD83_10990 [Cordyceps sp. RAO-2017]|nr:hypothetical protein CDD83_10990 [Cordyceps sp. RAO-2017]